MTVIELIIKLAPYAPHMRVVLPGYESGLDDIRHIKPVAIQTREWNKHMPDHEGQHVPIQHPATADELAILLMGRHSTLP